MAEPPGQVSVGIPRRKGRTARLEVRTISLGCPPPYAKSGPIVEMTLVHAREQGPDGPVEWFLLTTLGVGSFEQVGEIVGFYALR